MFLWNLADLINFGLWLGLSRGVAEVGVGSKVHKPNFRQLGYQDIYSVKYPWHLIWYSIIIHKTTKLYLFQDWRDIFSASWDLWYHCSIEYLQSFLLILFLLERCTWSPEANDGKRWLLVSSVLTQVAGRWWKVVPWLQLGEVFDHTLFSCGWT